jgi:hypothetical protein
MRKEKKNEKTVLLGRYCAVGPVLRVDKELLSPPLC